MPSPEGGFRTGSRRVVSGFAAVEEIDQEAEEYRRRNLGADGGILDEGLKEGY